MQLRLAEDDQSNRVPASFPSPHVAPRIVLTLPRPLVLGHFRPLLLLGRPPLVLPLSAEGFGEGPTGRPRVLATVRYQIHPSLPTRLRLPLSRQKKRENRP